MTARQILGLQNNKNNRRYISTHGKGAIIGSVIDGCYANDYSIDRLIEMSDARIKRHSQSNEAEPFKVRANKSALTKAISMREIFVNAKKSNHK